MKCIGVIEHPKPPLHKLLWRKLRARLRRRHYGYIRQPRPAVVLVIQLEEDQ